LVLPIIAFSLSSTKLEIRVKYFLPGRWIKDLDIRPETLKLVQRKARNILELALTMTPSIKFKGLATKRKD
jgi:hypothetical protein